MIDCVSLNGQSFGPLQFCSRLPLVKIAQVNELLNEIHAKNAPQTIPWLVRARCLFCMGPSEIGAATPSRGYGGGDPRTPRYLIWPYLARVAKKAG
jgi:hypothetical protein